MKTKTKTLFAAAIAVSSAVALTAATAQNHEDAAGSAAAMAQELAAKGVQTMIIRDNLAAGRQAPGLSVTRDYESSWSQVGSAQETRLIFDLGFEPALVSVKVQMFDCEGDWAPRYSFVPPAHTSWDDMYTGNENVYWVEGDSVIVHHEATIQGEDIHGGCDYQRFKVYAWR